MFAASTKVGAILANQDNKIKQALEVYGKNLGLTFQIADDTLDYNSDLKIFGKEIGNDFYEGKITLPIILVYQKASKSEKIELRNIFEKQIRDTSDLQKVLNLIKDYNIYLQFLEKYFSNKNAEPLPTGPDLAKIIYE